MCEEHSVTAVLRREEFPKYLNRKKEKGQFVFLPNYCLDQLNCAWLFTEIWVAEVGGTSDTNLLAHQLADHPGPSSQLVQNQESQVVSTANLASLLSFAF